MNQPSVNECREKLRTILAARAVISDHRTDRIFPYEREFIFDLRAVVLDPEVLALIVEVLHAEVAAYPRLQIGGRETAAIPLITALVTRCHAAGQKVTGFYLRKSRKKRDRFRYIEGELTDAPIVLLDDLLNSGTSILEQLTQLEWEGYSVEQVITLVRFRSLEYYQAKFADRVRWSSIFSYDEVGLPPPQIASPPDARQLTQVLPRAWFFRAEQSYHFRVVPRATPVRYQEMLFVSSDDGFLYALDIASGTTRWRYGFGLPSSGKVSYSTPVVHDGCVYVGAYDGKFVCLNAEAGAVQWVYAGCEWIGSSPAVDAKRSLIFIGLEHTNPNYKGSVVALQAKTGELVWEYIMPALTHASPLVVTDQNRVYIGGNEGVLYCLTADKGELVWKFVTEGGQKYNGLGGFSPGDIKMAPAYDSVNHQVAFGSMDGYVYVVDCETGTLNYRIATELPDTTLRAGVFSSPVFAAGKLLFGALDKTVRAHDAKTGTKIWSHHTWGRIFTSPRVYDGRVYIGNTAGTVYVIEVASGKVVHAFAFPDRVMAPVLIERVAGANYLFVFTNSTHLIAAKLPSK